MRKVIRFDAGSSRRGRRVRLALVLACAAAGWWTAGGADEPGPKPPAGAAHGRPVAVHGPGTEVERAVLDAALAFMREDPRGAKRALDGLAATFPGLDPEDGERFGEGVVGYDRAFRTTVARGRELAAAGDTERAFDQFVWVQRTCRICHDQARRSGLTIDLAPAPDARHSDGVADPER